MAKKRNLSPQINQALHDARTIGTQLRQQGVAAAQNGPATSPTSADVRHNAELQNAINASKNQPVRGVESVSEKELGNLRPSPSYAAPENNANYRGRGLSRAGERAPGPSYPGPGGGGGPSAGPSANTQQAARISQNKVVQHKTERDGQPDTGQNQARDKEKTQERTREKSRDRDRDRDHER